MANFSSLNFIFRFLPIFIILYYLVPVKARAAVSIVGSLVFYAVGEPIYIVLLVILSLFNCLMARACFVFGKKGKKSNGNGKRGREKQRSNKRRALTVIMITIDVLTLFSFKALNFIDKNMVIPLGLSFYIFKMISLQSDILMGKIKRKPAFWDIINYFVIFPQISQGPIMRFEDILWEKGKKLRALNLEKGLMYFSAGLAMKTLLADRIGILWNDIGMYGYDVISTPLAWMGVFAYSFELYFDFWGYSLMASGIMVAMGYCFIRNFDNPYASRTVSDFYRRWHMTLGAFFRDYVYFPMGGSRCSKARMVLNLAIVWLLTGLWHGNGLNFLIWGAFLGLLIIIEKLWTGKFLSKTFLGNIYVLFVIPISWMIFAIGDLGSLLSFGKRLFGMGGNTPLIDCYDFLPYIKDYGLLFLAAIILCIPSVVRLFIKWGRKWYGIAVLMILFWVSVYFCALGQANPFMYLRF